MHFARITLITLLIAFTTLASAHAEAMDQELTALKDKLTKSLVAKGRKKVAALDFTDLQGRRNELGRYLAEQLTVELVGTDGIAVVDRANLKSILDEHKLTEEGLVNPENAKKLGQFSGVDAILIGNLSATDSDIILLVKAISTDTAEVVAAGRAKFPKTAEFQQLLTSSITPGSDSGAPPGSNNTAAGSVDPKAIATKEIGRLRVTLKNVVPLKESGAGSAVVGVVCSFDFANLDLRKILTLAHNGQYRNDGNGIESCSTLSDASGHEWRLRGSNGLPGVGCDGENSHSNIVQIIRSGERVDSIGQLHNTFHKAKWYGSFVTIEPGASKRVSMTFRYTALKNQDKGVSTIDSFQLDSELIVGIADPGSKDIVYSLETLLFDKVVMSETDDK